MSIIQVDNEDVKTKLSIIKRYPIETLLLGLLVVVGWLFYKVDKVQQQQANGQDEQIEYFKTKGIEQVRKISENTEVLREIKTVLLENQQFLKQSKNN